MRRKRRTIAVLVLAMAVVLLLVFKNAFGRGSIPIAWIVMIAGSVIANSTLTCPACGKRLGGLFQTACAQCGVLLTDKVAMLPAQQGSVDPVAAEYMAASRRILARWASARRRLRWGVPLSGVVTMILMIALLPDDDWASRMGMGLLLGVVASGVGWFIFIHLADNLFGVVFMLFRGRCPLCRAWFTAPTTVAPGSMETDFSLPLFCGSCGAKLA